MSVTCPICRRDVSLFELANADGYRGEPEATCASCAQRATMDQRRTPREHRLDRRDPDSEARRRLHQRQTELPTGTDEQIWHLCQRCLEALQAKPLRRMKATGTPILFRGVTEFAPQPLEHCSACNSRSAIAMAFVRTAAGS